VISILSTGIGPVVSICYRNEKNGGCQDLKNKIENFF